ncbi:XrtA system polysaccharide chain length determinant [Methyloversatilis sp.]|uniref:XrtA system polysaccharide chain length determinant n=1 Tax=Methyloversatilis sp. TaxID=2569862 RepID=UPI00273378C8|nr:XrtA system polysaccharide chain length determinant [Methyloversatilis sp.]MDP2867673.1 GNVR domain-containing protein [Methyloversatilis sp.]MDP3456671.1 GNVR domain-containing protein [Methyloversatilis sp.]MDP3577237.1 GNVR domain-containing protein [Methyloversatilis sp.]
MDDLLGQLSGYARQAWGYRWVGLVTAWLIGVIGMGVVLILPDQYQASAKIYVDTQSILRPLMSGLAVQPNIDQQINMLSRTLISRPNIEKLIRMADLDLEAKTKTEKDKLIDELITKITLSSSGRDNLYFVSFRDEKPPRAQKVVQAMVSLFVESGLGSKRLDSDQARKFIEEQIKSYEAKLLEAENRVKEFRLKNLERPGGGQKDYFGSLGEVQNQLSQAQLELREASNSRDSLARQLLGEEPTIAAESTYQGMQSSKGGPSTAEIDARISAINNDIEALLQRYTDRHPDIVLSKARIRALEAERKEIVDRYEAEAAALAAKEEPVATRKPVAGSQQIPNPVYLQIKIALASAEASVASLGARVAEYQGRLEKLRQSSRLVPELEAEFAQLNRDYDIHKTNYNNLVSRRESASMAEEMDATGVAEFRLIEPPRVAPQPVAPNRLILLTAVIVAALLVGVAASFVVSQLRPVFHDGQKLSEISGVPVLGSVSMLLSDDRKKYERRRSVFFFGGVSGLVATYAAILAFVSLVMRSA